MGDYQNVSSGSPCRICHKSDWCSFCSDGTAICRRVSGGFEHTDRNGELFWAHLPDDRPADWKAPEYEAPIAPKVSKDAPEVYAYALSLMNLSVDHHESLLNRGISNPENYGLVSASSRDSYRIAKAVFSKFPDTATGVPGFSVKDGRPSFGVSDGIVIPVRNLKQVIKSLRLRKDEVGSGGRYRCLSSVRHGGPGPGLQIGFWGFPQDGKAETTRLTEGELKSIVAFERTGIPTVSAPGVSLMASKSVLDSLSTIQPRTVLLAPDSDAMTNPNVARAVRAAIARLKNKTWELLVEVWSPAYKGIDDALAAGCELNRLHPEEYLSTLPTPEVTNEASSGEPPNKVLAEYPGWERPFPLAKPASLPEYPVWAFPTGLVRDFVLALKEACQIPISYACTAVLATASIATLKRVAIDNPLHGSTHLNIYVITSLDSGSGKSTAMERVLEPVYQWERKLVSQAPKVEGSICHVGVVASDLTAEALERKFSMNDGRFAIANSEAVDQLNMISGDLYGNGKSCANMAPFLNAFGGNAIKSERVTRGGTHILGPRLTLFVAVQPKGYEQFMSSEQNQMRGFTARVLPDAPDNNFGRRNTEPRPMPTELREAWARVITGLMDISPSRDANDEIQPHLVQFDPDALEAYRAFRRESEEDMAPGGRWEPCRSFGSRASEHMLKLAGLLHCLSFPERPWGRALSAETLRGAIAVFNYHAHFAQRLAPSLKEEARTKSLEYVLSRIRSKPGKWQTMVSVPELHQLVKGRGGVHDMASLRSLLHELEELGYLREFQTVRGKPAAKFLVSPYVFDENAPGRRGDLTGGRGKLNYSASPQRHHEGYREHTEDLQRVAI